MAGLVIRIIQLFTEVYFGCYDSFNPYKNVRNMPIWKILLISLSKAPPGNAKGVSLKLMIFSIHAVFTSPRLFANIFKKSIEITFQKQEPDRSFLAFLYINNMAAGEYLLADLKGRSNSFLFIKNINFNTKNILRFNY